MLVVLWCHLVCCGMKLGGAMWREMVWYGMVQYV